VQPPLSAPGEFGQLEVPQVEVVGDTPVLLFSCGIPDIASARRSREPDEPTGSYLAIGTSLLGPWDIPGERVIPVPDLYSARLVRDPAGEWQVLGFIDGSPRGAFAGELSDPIPLRGLGLM
jgi:beta-fructofuranosidase